jgi:hypothetical protein
MPRKHKAPKKSSTKPTKGWTPERRAAQAERIAKTKPWESSTGPKTAAGKKRSAMNAYKHGGRARVFDRLRYLLWLNAEFVRMASGSLDELSTNELRDRHEKRKKIKADLPLPPSYFPNEVRSPCDAENKSLQ